jgi:hypothetical protein
MGETAAAVAIGGWRPNGLMQRLAALDLADRPVAGRSVHLLQATLNGRAFFALGLLLSLLLGGALHFALPRAAAKVGVVLAPPASTLGAIWQRRHQLVLDMPIVRGDAPAAFPLLVSGLDGVRDAHVILQDLPEPVWFSRGERRDEHTWELASSDLEDLQMTLRAGSPEAFGLDIEVVGPNAALLARSSAFVRLVDGPTPAASSAALADTALAASAPGMPDRTADVAMLDWSARTLTKPLLPRDGLLARPFVPPAAPSSPAVAQAAADIPPPSLQRPPGMSGLGAVSHEAAAEGRWLWWKLPAPAWAVFASGDGARR